VFDSESREPLIGGMVMIDGTALGNVTNNDGYYFITDVPGGVVTIRAEYLGYASISRQLEVPAGETLTVDFGRRARADPDQRERRQIVHDDVGDPAQRARCAA
jgi:hypothetical protein